ncbi:MAG TPA: hypothetical protein VIM43_04140 [Rugosibacter sp.]
MNITNTEDGASIEVLRSQQVLAEFSSEGSGMNANSATSWGAILAGAIAAAVLSLILLILGTGLGLASVSPWANTGASAKSIGISSIAWILITQLLASLMGGYLAGRLRTKWINIHTDETYFRDTAHGFLAWAVASLFTAAFLASAVTSIVSGGVQTATSIADSPASAMLAAGTIGPTQNAMGNGSAALKSGNNVGPLNYAIDSLLRQDASISRGDSLGQDGISSQRMIVGSSDGNMDRESITKEATYIFMNAFHTGSLPVQDVSYLGQLVSQRTGLSQHDAEKRVQDIYTWLQMKRNETETAARNAADKARKSSAYTALWLFISLLMGAFIASLAATYGGRHRDAPSA